MGTSELCVRAAGSSDSTWGGVRAAMGHPEPWELNFMAIGNEVGCQTGSEPLKKFGVGGLGFRHRLLMDTTCIGIYVTGACVT